MILERTRDEECLSDLTLDRMRVGELSASEDAAAREHLAGCERCAARRGGFAGDADAAALPPLAARRRGPWGVALVFAAAAAVTLIVTRPAPAPAPEPAPEIGERRKGAPTLRFHVRRGDAVLEGAPGEVLRPGDAIRFGYSWSEGGALAVLSRDGAGVTSVYFPQGQVMPTVAAGEAVDLPGATLLDDVTGPETFYGVFCARPVALERLRDAVEADPDAPRLPGECVIDRVRVEKRDGR